VFDDAYIVTLVFFQSIKNLIKKKNLISRLDWPKEIKQKATIFFFFCWGQTLKKKNEVCFVEAIGRRGFTTKGKYYITANSVSCIYNPTAKKYF
jgi:hypothetical protein